MSYLPLERLADKLGSPGAAFPASASACWMPMAARVKPGEVGEIVAEGDNVTLGYRVDDLAKAPFRDGKLYTGDMARTDEEGFIFVADRVHDFIKPKGIASAAARSRKCWRRSPIFWKSPSSEC
ncbi:MAG: AMP-binding protein [Anaerolineae bacterium]